MCVVLVGSVKTKTILYAEAIREALFKEMRREEAIFVIGEDMAKCGGVFQVTDGLLEEFGGPGRVIDTPLSENASAQRPAPRLWAINVSKRKGYSR
jgi:hypothetical protein